MTTETETRIKSAATEASRWFETAQRDRRDESQADPATYVRVKNGAPAYVKNVCLAAHSDGAMFPDDVRYVMIRDAVDAIAESSDDADLDDVASEFADDVDVYTNDLTAWLASRVDRYQYVDQAIEDYGSPLSVGNDGDRSGILDLIGLGQSTERREVFEQVRTALEEAARVLGMNEAES